MHAVRDGEQRQKPVLAGAADAQAVQSDAGGPRVRENLLGAGHLPAESRARQASMALRACAMGAPSMDPDRSSRITTRLGASVPKLNDGTIAAKRPMPLLSRPART
jgi:hypothetical protein